MGCVGTCILRYNLTVRRQDYVGVAITNLRVVCKTITCISEMAIIFLEAAAGLDTLRCRLRKGCHCGRLPSHYRRARVQRARQPLSRRAISGCSFTVACAGDFVLQLIRLESLGSELQQS